MVLIASGLSWLKISSLEPWLVVREKVADWLQPFMAGSHRNSPVRRKILRVGSVISLTDQPLW
jgi:hypothetical protein